MGNELLASLPGPEQQAVLYLDHLVQAGNGVSQPVGELEREDRIGRAPDGDRRNLELAQPRLDGQQLLG
jgi:hypothetical protein